MSTQTPKIIRYSANGAPIYDVPREKKNNKHMLCNSISKGRSCPHGASCWYAHSEEEQKQNLIKKPCRFLKEDGTCSKPNCKFDHSIKPERFAAKSDKKCKFFDPATGTCRFGDTCMFSHDMSEPKITEEFIIDLSDEDDEEVEQTPEPTFVLDENLLDMKNKLIQLEQKNNQPQVEETTLIEQCKELVNNLELTLPSELVFDDIERTFTFNVYAEDQAQLQAIINKYYNLLDVPFAAIELIQ
jgi:hypothetical protein